MNGGATDSKRDKRKAETREKTLAYARERFARDGFEATTIDAICKAAGISRRTFFRYFPSKEALVFPNHEARLERFRQLIESAPLHENPFDTLRRGTQLFAREYTQNREHLVPLQELIRSSAVLLAREREIDYAWECVIAEAFQRVFEDTPAGQRRARVLAGAVMGVVRATMREWYAAPSAHSLIDLGLEALDALQRGFHAE